MAAEEPTYTVRYRLTPENARQAFWFSLGERLPFLIGIVLLSLVCATWRPLGSTGRGAAVFFPALTGLTVLWMWNRTKKSLEPFLDREFVLLFSQEGLRIDSSLWKTDLPWTTIRRIVRGRTVWLVSVKHGSSFYIPTAAIPTEARALVARWAGQAGARLN